MFEGSYSQAAPQHMENFTNATIHSAIHIHVTLLLFLLISTTMFILWKVNVIIRWLSNYSSHFCFAQHFHSPSDSSVQTLSAVLDLACLRQTVFQHEDYFYIKESIKRMAFFKIWIQKIVFIILIYHFLDPFILQFISK